MDQKTVTARGDYHSGNTQCEKPLKILYFMMAVYLACLDGVADAGKVGAVLYAQTPARVTLVEALQRRT